jgi:hypothetical protein
MKADLGHPLDCGSLLPLSPPQPAAECQWPADEKPISSSLTTHSLPAAGCVVKSGSRLPQSM